MFDRSARANSMWASMMLVKFELQLQVFIGLHQIQASYRLRLHKAPAVKLVTFLHSRDHECSSDAVLGTHGSGRSRVYQGGQHSHAQPAGECVDVHNTRA